MSIQTENPESLIPSHLKVGDEIPLPSVKKRQICPADLDTKPVHDYYQAILAEKMKQLELQSTIIYTLYCQLHKANANVAHLSNQNLHDRARLQTYSDQEAIHLRKIEELEEENEAHLDTINTLIATERKQQDTIRSAEAQALAFIRAAQKCEWAGPAMLDALSIKYMGSIDSVEWERAYKQRFGPWMLQNCDSNLLAWQEQIQNSEWHPFKIVEVDGVPMSSIDEHDPFIQCLSSWGPHLYELVVNALKEMETYNASGRFPTPVLWDSRHKEPLELADFIDELGGNIKVLDELFEAIRCHINHILIDKPLLK